MLKYALLIPIEAALNAGTLETCDLYSSANLKYISWRTGKSVFA